MPEETSRPKTGRLSVRDDTIALIAGHILAGATWQHEGLFEQELLAKRAVALARIIIEESKA